MSTLTPVRVDVMSSVGRCQDSTWKVSGLCPVWVLILCSKTTRWDVRLLGAVIHWFSCFSRSLCSRQQWSHAWHAAVQLCFTSITVNTHVSVSSYWLIFLPRSSSAVTLCFLKFLQTRESFRHSFFKYCLCPETAVCNVNLNGNTLDSFIHWLLSKILEDRKQDFFFHLPL